jgi:hypothetical protein
MILNKYKVYLYVINNDKYDSYKNSNLLPEDNTYFSYMMYLPIYLDYRQGYLNLESQSFIYYGNSEL